MSDDLERLVLEKHTLLRQRGEMASVICALVRQYGGKDHKITLAKTSFVPGDQVSVVGQKSGAVVLTVEGSDPGLAPEPAPKPAASSKARARSKVTR